MSRSIPTASLGLSQYISIPLYVILVFGSAFALGKLFSWDIAGLFGMWKLFVPVGSLLFILHLMGSDNSKAPHTSSQPINRSSMAEVTHLCSEDDWCSEEEDEDHVNWMNISDPVTGNILPFND